MTNYHDMNDICFAHVSSVILCLYQTPILILDLTHLSEKPICYDFIFTIQFDRIKK